MSKVMERIEELGIHLPQSNRMPPNQGMVPIKREGDLLYTMGVGPFGDDGDPLWRGKLGADLTVEEGYQAARQCGIVLLGHLQEYLGDLDRVASIVKVLGFVASAPDFYDQPRVMHGFTDLMVEVFGELGRHPRSAIGTSVLPDNMPVEVEMIVRVHS